MIVLALVLVTLHTVDDRAVLVNPAYVITATEPKDKGGFTEEVQCVVSFVDAKFISVKETCTEVQAILNGNQP